MLRIPRPLVRPTLAAALSCLPGFLCFAQEGPELPLLKLEPLPIGQDARIEFQSSAPDETERRSTKKLRCTFTPSFEVCLDLEGIAENKFSSALTYLFYLESRQTPQPCPPVEVLVEMNPIGTFDDQEQIVDLKVSWARKVEEATLRIPIYRLSGGNDLDIFVEDLPVTLQIGSEGKIRISVSNRIDMELELLGPPSVLTENSELWHEEPTAELRSPGISDKNPAPTSMKLPRRAEARQLIVVKATPSYLEALSRAVRPYANDPRAPESTGVHEVLTVQIPYRNSAGIERFEELRIPIRFHPWIGQLLTAAAVGSLGGGLLRWLRIRKGTPRSLKILLISSILLAMAGEVLALILVSLDSKLRLIGLELDPYQLLSAGFLGFALGFLDVSYFENRLEELRKPRQNGSP